MERTNGSNRIPLRVLSALLPLLAGTLVVATTDSARAAWDGTQNIRAGDSVGAEFAGPAGTEVHRYTFYVPDKTVLNADLKPLGKVALTMNLRLLDSAGNAVNLGANLVGTSLKKFTIATRGYYTFEVTSTNGVGRYTMKTAAVFPKPIKMVAATCTLPVAPATTADTNFDVGGAPAGTVVKVASIKANKLNATAKLGFRKITGPNGTIDLGKPADLTDIVPLTGPVTLPQNGTYNLVVGNDGGGDKADLGVTLVYPKGGILYTFPVVETTAGTADENRTKWLASAHNDLASAPFSDWNDAVPAVVPSSCAKCHSTLGYRDFVGADGPGHLNDPSPTPGTAQVATVSPPVGTGITCDACHNDATLNLSEVTFASGLKVTDLGKEARCMVCHQGRESTVSLEAAIDKSTLQTKVTNVESTTTPGTGPGILGLNTAIVAGTSFTDTDADFSALGITGDGTWYLEFVRASSLLNGTTGVVSTKNSRHQITLASTANTLTLDAATPLVAETPATGKSFQYRITRRLSDDTPSGTTFSSLGFKNIHYFAAAGTLYGREAAAGYEYPDTSATPGTLDPILKTLAARKHYDRKFTHVAAYDTCIACHDPHSLKVKVSECAACHSKADGTPVATEDDLRDIRMAASVNDFNGDGNTTQGIWYELNGLNDRLLDAIKLYANTAVGSKPAAPIAYAAESYPYWFKDTNGNGVADAAEAVSSNGYTAWTAALVRAAYNYQVVKKDPGSFAHNGKFAIELVYDAIADLNRKVAVPNFSSFERNDPGHFDSDDEPYTDWNATDAVSATCSRCHSVDGFKFVVKYGVENVLTNPTISGMSCESCHTVGTSFAPEIRNPNPDKKPAREYVASVFFPYAVASSTVTQSTYAQIQAVTIKNGAKGANEEDDSLVCMTCHRARESKLTIDAADPTGATVNFTLSTKSPHYYPAGAIQYGSKAAVGYQYNGNTYVQRWNHTDGYTKPYAEPVSSSNTMTPSGKCKFCHMQGGDHSFQPQVGSTCQTCHGGQSLDTLVPFGRAQDNWDNDATTTPKAETAVFAGRLLTAIQNYAKAAVVAGTSGAQWALYSDGTNYASVTTSRGFYQDINRNGTLDTGDFVSGKLVASLWDTKGARATFNYRLWANDPGAWAHNPRYILQILYDAAKDLDPTTVVGLTRP